VGVCVGILGPDFDGVVEVVKYDFRPACGALWREGRGDELEGGVGEFGDEGEVVEGWGAGVCREGQEEQG
jgi:hypothetical protein